MIRFVPRAAFALVVAALLMVGGGAYALASSNGGTVTVCVKHNGGTLYKAGKCAKHDKTLSWNKQGPQGLAGGTGATGPQGPQGRVGATGAQGQRGAAAVASVTTRIDDSGGFGVSVAAGGTFTASVVCNPGEIATGGGGVSGVGGDPNQPLSFVTIAASRPTPGTGTPTGWTVTFRNDDSTPHILAHKVYVNCITPGS